MTYNSRETDEVAEEDKSNEDSATTLDINLDQAHPNFASYVSESEKMNRFLSGDDFFEAAKGEEPAKDETDEAAIEEGENGEIINNNTKKASMGSRMTSLLSAMKKQVSRKEKYTEAGGESGEVNTPVSID